MKIGMVAKIRHGALLKFRKDMGITQAAAAKMAGVSHRDWNALECMHFGRVPKVAVKAIAELVGEPPESVSPEELKGKSLGETRIAYREVPAHTILDHDAADRLILPSPADVACDRDEIQSLMELLKFLPYRKREIIELRYGIGYDRAYTLEEAGKIMKITRERVRQIEISAIRLLRDIADKRRTGSS